MPDLNSRIAAGLVNVAAAGAAPDEAARTGCLHDRIDAQARVIRTQAAMLTDNRRTFERASTEAGLGLWQCRLRDGTLDWSNGVYDLFEIPRGTALRRDGTLAHYPKASLRAMETARTQAIAAGTGFRLDTEIVTARGRRR